VLVVAIFLEVALIRNTIYPGTLSIFLTFLHLFSDFREIQHKNP